MPINHEPSFTDTEPPYHSEYIDALPGPFRYKIDAIESQVADVWNSEMPLQEQEIKIAELTSKRADLEREAVEAFGGYEKVKENYHQVKRILKRNKKIVKTSGEIGINPSVAKEGSNFNLIADVLLTRGKVEKLCQEPIGGFTPPLEETLDTAFNRFVESSRQLSSTTPNPTLTAEVERVTQIFNKKRRSFPLAKRI